MARVTHVKRAQKDYPAHGIKKGEPYYWWKFRFGGKHFSKTYPKASQLTQSEFWGTVNELQERSQPEFDSIESERDDIVSALDDLYNELDEKFNNMPEGLQQGDTGQLLESRRDSVESAKNDIENIDIPDEDAVKKESDDDFEPDDEEPEDEDAKETRHGEALEAKASEIWQEIRDALGGISD